MSAIRASTPNFNFTQQARPSSPPETPTAGTFTFGSSSRATNYHGLPSSAPSSSSRARHDTITATGDGHKFSYRPSPRPEELSPRSSTPSSEESVSPPRSLSSTGAGSQRPRERASQTPKINRQRIVGQGNFILEELRSDLEFNSDDEGVEILRPDHYEDAESDYAHEKARRVSGGSAAAAAAAADELDPAMLHNLQNLCAEGDGRDEHDEWIRQKRMRNRKNRLSSGSLKRGILQSLNGDSDREDQTQPQPQPPPPFFYVDGADEAGASARRLRRRVGEKRASLLLLSEDPPGRIEELNEPESNADEAIETDEFDFERAQCVDRELPYYVQDAMDTD